MPIVPRSLDFNSTKHRQSESAPSDRSNRRISGSWLGAARQYDREEATRRSPTRTKMESEREVPRCLLECEEGGGWTTAIGKD
jgi:hypothetical protein